MFMMNFALSIEAMKKINHIRHCVNVVLLLKAIALFSGESIRIT